MAERGVGFGEFEQRQLDRIRGIPPPAPEPFMIINPSFNLPSVYKPRDDTKERLAALETEVKELRRMVTALWDMPGAPGANAVLEEFEGERKKRKTEDEVKE